MGFTATKLEIVETCLRFKTSRGDVAALQSLSLTVEDGEFVCILGPSGCGKSTLLNVVAGFIACTSGHVKLDGRRISGPGPDRGVVFQENALFPWLTVRDNIAFGLDLRGVPRPEQDAVVKKYVELMGLHGFEGAFPKELSGGMKQRTAIARALANDPEILLMDEPFGALDAQTRRVLQDELARIWAATRSTVLFVTHSVEETLILADRVVVMTPRPGRLRDIVKVDLPRPRKESWPEFVALKSRLLDSLCFTA